MEVGRKSAWIDGAETFGTGMMLGLQVEETKQEAHQVR
jgi:hypothetical protein